MKSFEKDFAIVTALFCSWLPYPVILDFRFSLITLILAHKSSDRRISMAIPNASFIILFVKKHLESGNFYSRLLGLYPVEQSATFVLFALPNGLMLGLWSRTTARPIVMSETGGNEICFSEDSEEQVDKIYNEWLGLGVPMAQSPLAMDGMKRTFVALDPDFAKSSR